MKLLGNRILVKKDETAVTKSGIILPGSHIDPIFWGTVIKTGPGFQTNDGTVIPTETQPGDSIAYTSSSGWYLDITDDNGVKEKYTILNERDVLLISNKE